MRAKTIFQAAAAVLSSAGLAAFAAAPAAAQAVTVFYDDFDGTSVGTWASTQNVTTTDPGSLLGSNAFYFNGAGGSPGGDRFAVTQSLDLSGKNAIVNFFLRYEGNGMAMGEADQAAFDQFDNSNDDLVLSYTTDGSTFTPVTTFAFNDNSYRTGANFSVVLPSGAWTTTTQIRIYQSGASSANNRDQWAIDNFEVLIAPEPGTWALFSLGTAGLGAWVHGRRKRRPRAEAAPNAGPRVPGPGA